MSTLYNMTNRLKSQQPKTLTALIFAYQQNRSEQHQGEYIVITRKLKRVIFLKILHKNTLLTIHPCHYCLFKSSRLPAKRLPVI